MTHHTSSRGGLGHGDRRVLAGDMRDAVCDRAAWGVGPSLPLLLLTELNGWCV
jgi:hypothetical protein